MITNTTCNQNNETKRKTENSDGTALQKTTTYTQSHAAKFSKKSLKHALEIFHLSCY